MDAHVTDEGLIKTAVDGGIGRITLNRPTKRNAINTAMSEAFVAACRTFADQGVKVCILDAEGPVFSGGADTSDPNMSAAFGNLYEAMLDAPFVWVACLTGPVIGAGVAMAALAAVVVAGPDVWVSLPEIRTIKKFPHGVVAKAKPFVSQRWLMAMALSGEKSSVEAAAKGGLVTEITARGEERAAAQRWAGILGGVDASIVSQIRTAWFAKP